MTSRHLQTRPRKYFRKYKLYFVSKKKIVFHILLLTNLQEQMIRIVDTVNPGQN